MAYPEPKDAFFRPFRARYFLFRYPAALPTHAARQVDPVDSAQLPHAASAAAARARAPVQLLPSAHTLATGGRAASVLAFTRRRRYPVAVAVSRDQYARGDAHCAVAIATRAPAGDGAIRARAPARAQTHDVVARSGGGEFAAHSERAARRHPPGDARDRVALEPPDAATAACEAS